VNKPGIGTYTTSNFQRGSSDGTKKWYT
jgi:hypothetical protein